MRRTSPRRCRRLIATARAPARRKLRRLARREAHVWRAADGYVTITQAPRRGPRGAVRERPRLHVVPDDVPRRRCGARALDRGAAPSRRPSAAPDRSLSGAPVVAYAGHLYAWKGVDVLLEALALRARTSDGLIVGGHAAEPDLARVKALAGRLGIADRVTFTGLVEPADVARAAARAPTSWCCRTPRPRSRTGSRRR